MGASLLPPLPPDTFDLTVAPAEFVDLTVTTLGDVGTNLDGFDPVFDAVATDHNSLPGLLQAIRNCFEKAHSPFADLGIKTENFVDDAQGEALTTIKAANDSFDSIFVAAPPPPVVEGAAPPSTPGPSGGPPTFGVRAKACPPGSTPEASDPAFCVPAGAIGPVTGPQLTPPGPASGFPPRGTTP